MDPAALRLTALRGQVGFQAAGEVDLSTGAVWRSALETMATRGADLHLDLGRVTFVDVAGAAALVTVARHLAPGRRMVLHAPPSVLLRALEVLWPDARKIEVRP